MLMHLGPMMRTKMKEEKEDWKRRKIRADALSSRVLAVLSVLPLPFRRPRERFQNS
jgi:hypothetical protein